MDRWQLQEAKARLSEVVKASEAHGPQEITVRGRAAAVLVSKADYERLRGSKPTFLALMRQSPWFGLALNTQRDKTPARDVAL